MSVKIYKAMIKEFDAEEAKRSALEDWNSDSSGATATGSPKTFTQTAAPATALAQSQALTLIPPKP